jgi:predicted acyl esterase
VVARYRVRMPEAHHTFLPGHRIMVQVQSSWFPLYDRNPQTFVENVAEAGPGDYRSATHRIWLAPGQASYVELPLVAAPTVSGVNTPSAAPRRSESSAAAARSSASGAR